MSSVIYVGRFTGNIYIVDEDKQDDIQFDECAVDLPNEIRENTLSSEYNLRMFRRKIKKGCFSCRACRIARQILGIAPLKIPEQAGEKTNADV